MKSDRNCPCPRRRGSALVLSLLFIVIFSALATALAGLSGTNVQIARNQRDGSRALCSAESGLEVMQYWLMRVRIPDSTAAEHVLGSIAADLVTDLAASSVTNLTVSLEGSGIHIPAIPVGSYTNQNFEAEIRRLDDATLQMDVTGHSGEITRVIRVNFPLIARPHPIFDFGMATKGPLQMPGNPTAEGATALGEADIYIESYGAALALEVGGNTNLAGEITIANPSGCVFFDGALQIAGDYGEEAVDNHVTIGAEPLEFPLPDTDHFRPYATGTVITSSTDTSSMTTLTNVRIAAGANKVFDKSVIINGVLFIEAPNIIQFTRNVEIRGMVVADGDIANPGGNCITIGGNLYSVPFPSDAAYDVMRHEAGSSLLAPGFAFELPGNLCSMGGVMAVSGMHVSGNVDATIQGTIINYSDTPILIEGNPTFRFSRSAYVQTPAGFASDLTPVRDPSSYREISL